MIPWTLMIKVKIRPCWDWNSLFLAIKWAIAMRLKSDHAGIEISIVIADTFISISSLKSDHAGIEIAWLRCGTQNRKQVKIRPCWDWNYHWKTVLSCHWLHVKIRPCWDWNDIRSVYCSFKKCGLKSDHAGIEICSAPPVRPSLLLLVKIRPCWDWNVFYL